jgi:exopolysaccharide production protein ExoZ
MEQKLPGLQIARAVAALAIAYFHSRNVVLNFAPEAKHPIKFLMDNGGFAVQFFFAISGYVICVAVTRPNFNLATFAIKRAFRLYPLWLLCCAIYWNIATPSRGTPITDTPDFIFRSFALLPTQGFPLLDVGWSLQHEIQFYLIAALLVPFTGLAGLCAWLVLGAVAVHALELPWWLSQYAAQYPFFLAGIVAFLLRDQLKRLGFLLPFVVGAAMFWYAATKLGSAFFPIPFGILVVAFANLPIKSMIGRAGVLLGDASYSIYLWHPIIITESYYRLSPDAFPSWMVEPIRLAVLLIVCLVSIASWKLYETPMNKLGSFIARLTRPAAQPRPASGY